MTMTQLTIDGREVELDAVGRLPRTMRLGPRQRAVMRELGLHGSIRPIQAGRVIHSERGACGSGVRDYEAKSAYGGEGCCRYASSDGSIMLKTLAGYGLVEKIGGVWYRVHDESSG